MYELPDMTTLDNGVPEPPVMKMLHAAVEQIHY
jgi:hypothetical protein